MKWNYLTTFQWFNRETVSIPHMANAMLNHMVKTALYLPTNIQLDEETIQLM